MSNDTYYRYEDRVVIHWDDEFEYVRDHDSELVLHNLPVIRRTPKGVWVNHFGTAKFILDGGHKHFACKTKKLALESFIARKRRQVAILSTQLERAKVALSLGVLETGNEN